MLTDEGEFIPTHGTHVLYQRRIRDFFCRSYIVVCSHCDNEWGPYRIPELARAMANQLQYERCDRK